MYKFAILAVVALAASGCAVESGSAGAEDVGSASQELELWNSPHFVQATLSNGFANCPANEVMLGTDAANGTRLVCQPITVYFAPSHGKGFDGDRPSPFTRTFSNGVASCGTAVAIGWNPSTKALRCRLTSDPTYSELPAAQTNTNYDLQNVSHITYPYFQFHNPALSGAGNNDELPKCQGSRGVTEMALKNIAYYNNGTFQYNVLSGFFTCGI